MFPHSRIFSDVTDDAFRQTRFCSTSLTKHTPIFYITRNQGWGWFRNMTHLTGSSRVKMNSFTGVSGAVVLLWLYSGVAEWSILSYIQSFFWLHSYVQTRPTYCTFNQQAFDVFGVVCHVNHSLFFSPEIACWLFILFKIIRCLKRIMGTCN